MSFQPERKSRTLLSVTVSTNLYGSFRLMNSSTLTVLKCLGSDSIEKFWLEKSLEFWLEIPYTRKKMF